MKTVAEIRQALTRLLHEERRLLQQLETLLVKEKALLLQDDSPELLEEAAQIRQECMVSLLNLQDERHGILRMTGFSTDNAGLASLIKACDPDRSLPPQWAECSEIAKRCRDLNDHNGALVTTRMRRIQGVLEMLTGARAEKVIYGRQAEQGFRSRGAVVAAEA
ncbi:MAG: flagellar export chaperone FlgN [Gammaproteobacteria bacterium]|nr:flagellar export chaperone FlgN [Gammaproteobacteria bacterium]